MSNTSTTVHKVVSVTTKYGEDTFPDGRISRWTQTTWRTADGHEHDVIAFAAPIPNDDAAPLTTNQPIEA